MLKRFDIIDDSSKKDYCRITNPKFGVSTSFVNVSGSSKQALDNTEKPVFFIGFLIYIYDMVSVLVSIVRYIL